MTTVIDKKITDFIAAKPWLKLVLMAVSALLGVAKGRAWFAQRYDIR